MSALALADKLSQRIPDLYCDIKPAFAMRRRNLPGHRVHGVESIEDFQACKMVAGQDALPAGASEAVSAALKVIRSQQHPRSLVQCHLTVLGWNITSYSAHLQSSEGAPRKRYTYSNLGALNNV